MQKDEFDALVQNDVLDFISLHQNEKVQELALRFSEKTTLPMSAICEQIRCRQKAVHKLPFLKQSNFLFTKRAFEQASGEYAAQLKRLYINGDRIADLSAGLGIDSIFFSKRVATVDSCEINSDLLKFLKWNLKQLKIQNIQLHQRDGIDFINSAEDKYYDWVYIDPDRRDQNEKRSVALSDYRPNIIEHEDLILKKSHAVCIKVSPLVELTELRKQLKSLDEFVVVSIDNECKEIWLILRQVKQYERLQIRALSYQSKDSKTRSLQKSLFSDYQKQISPKVLSYLYEADKAIIKARLSDKFAAEQSLNFLHANCDYLTSDQEIKDFWGRSFKVKNVLPYHEKGLKKFLKAASISKANVARRNFPDSVEFIRKRFKLKDGGNEFLFFTRNAKNEKICILAEALK